MCIAFNVCYVCNMMDPRKWRVFDDTDVDYSMSATSALCNMQIQITVFGEGWEWSVRPIEADADWLWLV